MRSSAAERFTTKGSVANDSSVAHLERALFDRLAEIDLSGLQGANLHGPWCPFERCSPIARRAPDRPLHRSRTTSPSPSQRLSQIVPLARHLGRRPPTVLSVADGR